MQTYVDWRRIALLERELSTEAVECVNKSWWGKISGERWRIPRIHFRQFVSLSQRVTWQTFEICSSLLLSRLSKIFIASPYLMSVSSRRINESISIVNCHLKRQTSNSRCRCLVGGGWWQQWPAAIARQQANSYRGYLVKVAVLVLAMTSHQPWLPASLRAS